MRRFLILSLIVAGTAYASDQSPSTAVGKDPFDLSAAEALIGKAELASVISVDELQRQAEESLRTGECTHSIELLDRYAREANTLANLIASGLAPFYNAGYDETKTLPPGRLSMLVPLEALANKYKARRNHAMTMQAECLAKLGQKEKAAAVYYQALNLTSIDDTQWWDRARLGLYSLLGVK